MLTSVQLDSLDLVTMDQAYKTLFPVGRQSIDSAIATRFAYKWHNFACVAFNGMQGIAREPADGNLSVAYPKHARCSYSNIN